MTPRVNVAPAETKFTAAFDDGYGKVLDRGTAIVAADKDR